MLWYRYDDPAARAQRFPALFQNQSIVFDVFKNIKQSDDIKLIRKCDGLESHLDGPLPRQLGRGIDHALRSVDRNHFVSINGEITPRKRTQDVAGRATKRIRSLKSGVGPVWDKLSTWRRYARFTVKVDCGIRRFCVAELSSKAHKKSGPIDFPRRFSPSLKVSCQVARYRFVLRSIIHSICWRQKCPNQPQRTARALPSA